METTAAVPKGNTQKNVNREVYKVISRVLDNKMPQTLIDVPSGEGQFGGFLKKQHPNLKVIGVDPFQNASGKMDEFHSVDALTFLKTLSPTNVDVITCISGVMCFDGLDELFGHFTRILKKGGTLVVTNDNVLTLRDRLSFVFLGYLKRFKPFYASNEGNWNIVFPQALIMHMERKGFTDIQVKYTAVYMEDWFLLPLVVLLYPISFLGLLKKAGWNMAKVLKIYPPLALMGRHYVVSAKKP